MSLPERFEDLAPKQKADGLRAAKPAALKEFQPAAPQYVASVLFDQLILDTEADQKPTLLTREELRTLIDRDFPGVTEDALEQAPTIVAKRLRDFIFLYPEDAPKWQLRFVGPTESARRGSRARGYLYLTCKTSPANRTTPPKYVDIQHPALQPALTPAHAPERGPHQLRRLPDNFTGREQLLVEAQQTVTTDDISIVGIRGFPGIGKTTFALALAERLAPRFPSQIFLDLKGNTTTPLTSHDVMTHVILAYRGGQGLPVESTALAGLYFTVLNEQRALIIFDNAKDAAQVQPLMPPQGHFLILTSRQIFTLPNLHPIDLPLLSPDDAQDLLKKIAPRCASEAPRIAALCGHLPFALCAVGSALERARDVAPAEYVKRLEHRRTRLELTDSATDVSVESSLSLSCSLLPRRVRQRLEALCVFPYTFDRDAAAYVWRTDKISTSAALSQLTNSWLLGYDAVTDRYFLHDLMSDYACSRLRTWRRFLLRYRYVVHYARLAVTADRLYQNGVSHKGLQLFRSEWPNIEAVLNLLEQHWPAFLAYVLDGCRHCLARHRPPSQRLRWLEAATARRLKKQLRARLMLDIAIAQRDLGDLERALDSAHRARQLSTEANETRAKAVASDIFVRALIGLVGIREETQPAVAALDAARSSGDSDAIQQALHHLGQRYLSSGAFLKAAECFQEQLSLAGNLGSFDEILPILHDIAVAYERAGEVSSAVEWSREELRVALRHGATVHESAAQGRLALCYERQGDIANANASYERRLQTLRDLDATIPSDDIQFVSREAYQWSRLEFPDRSAVLANLALQLAREIGNRPAESHALLVLGLAHGYRGDYPAMKQFLEEAGDLATSVGCTHLRAAADYVLSHLAAEQGDIAAAIAKAESVLAVSEQLPFFDPSGIRSHLTKLRHDPADLQE
jgi:tetratricopeptide (TPR) repeat protein